MREEPLLLTPGPVPLSDGVRRAMDEPMASPRSAAFGATYRTARAGLDYVFTRSTREGTATAGDGTSLVLTGTATVGMEAAVANLVDDGGEVVVLVNGRFGRRFQRIADRHARVTAVEADWGESFDLGAVAAAVDDDTDLVTMVHTETATGLCNPVGAVGEIVRDHGALFAVDGTASVGGEVFRIDDWNVDVAVAGVQGPLAAPPGLCAVYVTGRAAAAVDGDRAPYYEDLDWHRRAAAQHRTPFTSAVPLVRALSVAVEEIEAEGMAARIERHHRQARAVRRGFAAMGLDRFPDPEGATTLSNTVTAIELPEVVRASPDAFFDAVAERGVSVAGGQAHLDGRIVRVSNAGDLPDAALRRGVRVVGEAMRAVGGDVDVEAGLAAADQHLS
ncbi:MAG: alanine--glyoxylate aminotransferase family protein [Haloarculaceae archaeon]